MFYIYCLKYVRFSSACWCDEFQIDGRPTSRLLNIAATTIEVVTSCKKRYLYKPIVHHASVGSRQRSQAFMSKRQAHAPGCGGHLMLTDSNNRHV